MGRGGQSTAERTAYNRRWREENPDKVAAWRPRAAARMRDAHKKRRAELIKAYGGKCACCGETEPIFLTLDHVNGVPEQHKDKQGKRLAGTVFTRILYNQLPQLDPDLRVLCFNCNSGRQINDGICPHEQREVV